MAELYAGIAVAGHVSVPTTSPAAVASMSAKLTTNDAVVLPSFRSAADGAATAFAVPPAEGMPYQVGALVRLTGAAMPCVAIPPNGVDDVR